MIHGPDNQFEIVDGPSSQLEDRETTVNRASPKVYRDKFYRHYGSKMSAVELLFDTVDCLDKTNFLGRYLNCRSGAEFSRHEDTGEVLVFAHHCNLRWCPMCGAARQSWIAEECRRWFIQVHKPKLITLTLKHSNAPLAYQTKCLYDYFRKLRKTAWFKKHVRGGTWFYHIKKSQSDHKWHPHIHCLVDSDYIDKTELSKRWLKITGSSKVVHIKAVTNPENSVKHAARYSAEPCNVADLQLADAVELFYALQGKRICGSWGTARGISFRPKPPDDSGKWKTIGSWITVVENLGYDDNADAIMKAFRLNKPLDKGISMYALELEIYDNFIHAPPKFDPQGRFNFAA